MVYTAYELLAKLNCLTLTGQEKDGQLEWIGRDNDFRKLEIEEEAILRDKEIERNWFNTNVNPSGDNWPPHYSPAGLTQ